MYELTELRKILKPRFAKGQIKDTTLREYAFYGSIAMDDDFSGDNFRKPIKYAHQQTRGRTFSTVAALAAASNANPRFAMWHIDVTPDYFAAQVPRENALRTTGAEQYIKLFSDALKDGKDVVNQNSAVSLYGTEGGYRGQISATSGVAATYITLADRLQINNFESGMTVVLSAAADGTGIKGAPDTVTLGQIDRVNGRIYTSNGNNWNHATNCATIANSDYIYQSGDQAKGVQGLPSWLLTAAPTPGVTFNNVDRYVDQRLYGQYFNGQTYTVAEALRRALGRFAQDGGRNIDRVYLTQDDYDNLEFDAMSMGFLRRETAAGSKAGIGFEGIEISFGGGKKAIALPDVAHTTRGRAYLLTQNTWHLTHMNGGKGPGAIVIDDDGQYIRLASADAYDCRVGNFTQLWCEAPGENGICDLQT